MRQVSEPVMRALSDVIGIKVCEPLPQMPRDLLENIVRLSRQFTCDRGDHPTRYFDEQNLASAYLAYFFPVNLAKVQELLDEQLPVLPPRSEDKTLRVLDLGCGPGTGVLGVLDWATVHAGFGSAKLHCVAVDQSKRALLTCEALWKQYTRHRQSIAHALYPIQHDVRRGLGHDIQLAGGNEGYDLIIIQNLLNEIHMGRPDRIQARCDLIQSALRLLSPHGSIMLIEPALRESSRELHQVRDCLLASGACTLYSPCLHEKPCPALVKRTDWCHEERPWHPPDWIQAVDARVGFIKDALKFSYVLLRKDGQAIVHRRENVYRMVSELRVFKGETRAWLCNDTGRSEVGLLTKQRSPTNEAFQRGNRGYIIKIDGIVRKEKKDRPASLGRIPASGKVEILEPGDKTYSASGSVPP